MPHWSLQNSIRAWIEFPIRYNRGIWHLNCFLDHWGSKKHLLLKQSPPSLFKPDTDKAAQLWELHITLWERWHQTFLKAKVQSSFPTILNLTRGKLWESAGVEPRSSTSANNSLIHSTMTTFQACLTGHGCYKLSVFRKSCHSIGITVISEKVDSPRILPQLRCKWSACRPPSWRCRSGSPGSRPRGPQGSRSRRWTIGPTDPIASIPVSGPGSKVLRRKTTTATHFWRRVVGRVGNVDDERHRRQRFCCWRRKTLPGGWSPRSPMLRSFSFSGRHLSHDLRDWPELKAWWPRLDL